MGTNVKAIKRGFHYNPVARSLGIFVDGVQKVDLTDIAGRVYYVNNITGASTNDGLSWGTAFDQVDNAITASEAYRATFSANNRYVRNTIYIQGTGTDYEAVATATCNYTDFIGIGANPQGDGVGIAVISGANAADAFSLTATCRGLSFYNIQFDASGTSYCAFDCTALLRSRFEECAFMGDAHKNESLIAGLRATAAFDGNTIYRCMFASNWAGLTSGLSFGDSLSDTRIEECIIEATTNGIIISTDGLTVGGLVKDNVIHSGTYGIKSSSAQSILWIVGNYISSADAINIVAGSTTTGEHMCLGNYINNAGTIPAGLIETAAG